MCCVFVSSILSLNEGLGICHNTAGEGRSRDRQSHFYPPRFLMKICRLSNRKEIKIQVNSFSQEYKPIIKFNHLDPTVPYNICLEQLFGTKTIPYNIWLFQAVNSRRFQKQHHSWWIANSLLSFSFHSLLTPQWSLGSIFPTATHSLLPFFSLLSTLLLSFVHLRLSYVLFLTSLLLSFYSLKNVPGLQFLLPNPLTVILSFLTLYFDCFFSIIP